MKGQLQKVVVLLLFVACLAAILFFMPKEFEKAMGNGFDLTEIEKIQVTLVSLDGQDDRTVTLKQGEEEYVDLISCLQEPNYSRSNSKSDEITLDYQVYIGFATSEAWAWQYQFQGGKLVSLGPSGQTKTYQISGGEESQQKILDYLLTLEPDPS